MGVERHGKSVSSEVRGSRFEVRGSRFEVRGRRLEVGGWRLEGWLALSECHRHESKGARAAGTTGTAISAP
jgi:hypothetical protein